MVHKPLRTGNVSLWPSRCPHRHCVGPVPPGCLTSGAIVCLRLCGLPSMDISRLLDAETPAAPGTSRRPVLRGLCRAHTRASLATGTSHRSLSPLLKPQKLKSDLWRTKFPLLHSEGTLMVKDNMQKTSPAHIRFCCRLMRFPDTVFTHLLAEVLYLS